jgi:hypothetical protein
MRQWKKKLLSWNDILVSLHSWGLQDSKKCRSLTLLKHLFIRKLKKKKSILHGLSIPNPNFSEFAYFGEEICRLGNVDFNLPSNWWVTLLQKCEFTVLLLGFEKLGLELDNHGRTTKSAYYRIYSLCFEHALLRVHTYSSNLFQAIIFIYYKRPGTDTT